MQQRGYSLIEMLVVLAIVGLLVSVVSLSAGLGANGRADPARVGANLERILTTLADEAVLRAVPIGLSFAPVQHSGDERWQLRWLVWQQPVWVDLKDFMSVQHLPQGLVPSLTIEGEELSATDLLRINASGLPVLVFYPTGESTLFTLNLLAGSGTGSVLQLSNLNTGLVARSMP